MLTLWMYLWRVRKTISLRISRLKASLSDLETQLQHHSSAVSYFKSLAGGQVDASIDDDACIICFEPMTRLTVTPCGHLFCFDCITSCLTANGLCPTCRRSVRLDQLVEVKVYVARRLVMNYTVSQINCTLFCNNLVECWPISVILAL